MNFVKILQNLRFYFCEIWRNNFEFCEIQNNFVKISCFAKFVKCCFAATLLFMLKKAIFFIPPYSIQSHGDNQRILCLNNFKKTFSLKDPLVQSLLRISVTLLLKTTGADKRKARPSWTMITVFWRRSGQAGWPAAGLYVWACSSCWPPPEIILFKVFEKRQVDQPLVSMCLGLLELLATSWNNII